MLERIGKYHVIRAAGSGGFGTVYEGYDVELDRNVAIKICTGGDAQLERFRREARVVSQLKHRNIALVFDFGYDERAHVHYLVEEFLSGVDLDKKLEERDRLPPALRLLYMTGIAQGLEFVHERGLIHRDLSPRNVRVLHDHTIKIMDFGLAKDVTDATLTMIGDNFGTIGYTAPEQVTGMRTVDHRTDIFSLGVIAYELLTFTNPFMADNMGTFIQKIHHLEPRPLGELWKDCPPQLATAVHKCMSKDAGERFASCGELLPILKKALRYLRRHEVPALYAPPEEPEDGFEEAIDAVERKVSPPLQRSAHVDSGKLTSDLRDPKVESTNPLFATPMPLAPETKPAAPLSGQASSARGRLPGYVLGLAAAMGLVVLSVALLRPGAVERADAEPSESSVSPAAPVRSPEPASVEAEPERRSRVEEPSALWSGEPPSFELRAISTGSGEKLSIQLVASLPSAVGISHCYVTRAPSWSYGEKVRRDCRAEGFRHVDRQEIVSGTMYTYRVQVANAAGELLAESVNSSVLAGN